MTQYIAPNLAMAMQYSNQQGMSPSNVYSSGQLALANGGLASLPRHRYQDGSIGGGTIQGTPMSGGRTGYGFFKKLKRRVKKLIPKELAPVMTAAAPFVAPYSVPAALALSGLGQYKSKGKINPLMLALSAAPGVKFGGGQTEGLGRFMPSGMARFGQDAGTGQSLRAMLMGQGAGDNPLLGKYAKGTDKFLFGGPGETTRQSVESLLEPGKMLDVDMIGKSTSGILGSGTGSGAYAPLEALGRGAKAIFTKDGQLDKTALAALALGGMSYAQAKQALALDGVNLEDHITEEEYEGTDWSGWATGTHLEDEAELAHGGRVNYGIGGWLKRKLGMGQKEGHAEAHPNIVVANKDPDVMRQKLLNYFKAKMGGEEEEDFKSNFKSKWTHPFIQAAHGGRAGYADGGINRTGLQWGSEKGEGLGGEEVEADMRYEGGFMPYGEEPKADDVPARLSKDEFVFTDEAVAGAGDGDVNLGAERLYAVMKNLEQGGPLSQESQGIGGLI